MKCSKCGKEIRDDVIFCTNCGKKIRKNKEIKIKFNYLILLVAVTILIIIGIALIFVIKQKGHNISSNNDSFQNLKQEEEIDYKYITQDSAVSPTGKEFIGTFSKNLTDVVEKDISKKYSSIKNDDTSVNNLKKYQLETYQRSLYTGEKYKATEKQYYYNNVNNKIVGHRYYVSNKNSVLSNNTTLEEYERTYTNQTINIFRNLHNDSSENEVENTKKFIEYWTNQMNESGLIEGNITLDGVVYKYRLIGDVLKVVKTFDNDLEIELLFLAYDINTSPEETIKNWIHIISQQEATNNKNSISNISMNINIDSNGNASVTEIWNCYANSKTEYYHPYYNLGKSEISNFSVKDDLWVYSNNMNSWNTNWTFEEKSHRCGINKVDNGIELCWGISTYGYNTYTIKYDISNFVTKLEDAQMIYWQLIPSKFSNEIDEVDIKIKASQAFDNSISIWGYGDEGGLCSIENGKILMKSNNKLKQNEYMTILVKLPQNTFDTNNIVNKSFSYYYEMAEQGKKQ